MKIFNIIVFLLPVFLVACKPADDGFRELKDRDLKVQLIALKKSALPGDMDAFKIRLIPSAESIGIHGADKNKLLYNMDSCFYLVSAKTKIYPQFVQEVANGINNSYEYLVTFDRQQGPQPTGLTLVYADRYLTRRAYTFKQIHFQN